MSFKNSEDKQLISGGGQQNPQTHGIIPANDLALVANFSQSSSLTIPRSLSILLKLDQDTFALEKLFFMVSTLAVITMNFVSIQETLMTIINDSASAGGFSNYLVIVMAGLDVYLSFLYAVLGTHMGLSYYKYAMIFTFSYFVMFVAFDLRLFHLISRIFLERTGAQDVVPSNPGCGQVQEESTGLQHEALPVSLHRLLRYPEAPDEPHTAVRILGGASLPNLPQLPLQLDLPPRPVRPHLLRLHEIVRVRESIITKMYIHGYPNNFLELSTRPWIVILILCIMICCVRYLYR